MKDRIKFQVWSEDFQRWKTVYVRQDMLMTNVTLLRSYGIKFRVRQ